ncbi:MAG: tRNA dihydrouridine synthase [Bacteroidales bacterium]
MIILAPLHGFTDFIFRNVYSRHYTGIDLAVSPFISLTPCEKVNPRKAKDVLPENNNSIPVIPQILGKEADSFIQMAEFLEGLGYDKLNWNLGCPVKSIVNKKRGSGLLLYPDLLRSILDIIIPAVSQQISVKIRLGYNSTDEIYKLIPVFNDYPLENICIHPRIGKQMYEGEIYHDVLQSIIGEFKHEIIYNGDITNYDEFCIIQQKYPDINKWMIGRGVFSNPSLPFQINEKGLNITGNFNEKERFQSFLNDLIIELRIYKTETQTLNKMKDLWRLFSFGFVEQAHVLHQIIHVQSLDQMIEISNQIIHNEKRLFGS